tara:strand:- start:153368 stop:154078 length:711 start_codon:yes stop_codon:yes gene_type:complete
MKLFLLLVSFAFAINCPAKECSSLFSYANAVIPVSDVFRSGFGHIEIPKEFHGNLSSNGVLNKALDEIIDKKFDNSENWAAEFYKVRNIKNFTDEYSFMVALEKHIRTQIQDSLGMNIDLTGVSILVANSKREMPWHTDSHEAAYVEKSIKNDSSELLNDLKIKRKNPLERGTLRVTIPLPIDEAKPTITRSWDGTSYGIIHQAPNGFATIFVGGITIHKSDISQDFRKLIILDYQ